MRIRFKISFLVGGSKLRSHANSLSAISDISSETVEKKNQTEKCKGNFRLLDPCQDSPLLRFGVLPILVIKG